MRRLNKDRIEKLRQEYLTDRTNQTILAENALFDSFVRRLEQMEPLCGGAMAGNYIRTGTYTTEFQCTGVIPHGPAHAGLKQRLTSAYPGIRFNPIHRCTDSDCCLHERSSIPNRYEFQIMPEHFGVSDAKL